MPTLRIICPPERTDHIVELLHSGGGTGIAVVPGAGRPDGGDLVLADVPRSYIDPMLARVRSAGAAPGVQLAIQDSERLLPPAPPSPDDEAVVWAEVIHDLHARGRLSWVNVLLVVIAAGIAAIGILEGQLLLIVGAMALSPDYLPIANTYLALSRRAWRSAAGGLLTLAVCFGSAAVAAWLLAELPFTPGPDPVTAGSLRELTLFIARPDRLSLLVALLAGVAGALAVTLPGERGLVGVFVSVTTIPAAANIGVAVAARDGSELAGAAVQLLVNVAGLLVAGAVTLALRHRGRAPRVPHPPARPLRPGRPGGGS